MFLQTNVLYKWTLTYMYLSRYFYVRRYVHSRPKGLIELKYEVNLRFETQIWKPGPDLKMKNPETRSWIPVLLQKVQIKYFTLKTANK